MIEKIKNAIEKIGAALIRGIRWIIAATKKAIPVPAPLPVEPAPALVAERPAAQKPPVPPETAL